MKHITRKEIDSLDQRYRANLINSVAGYKPANLIGTVSADGITNLTIVSSVIHLGSDPPLIGFIQRPLSVCRDTYDNINHHGYYTINHVHVEFIEKAHQTSAKFDSNISEFEECGFRQEYLNGFEAPYVNESKVKIGMRLIQETPIYQNGTILMIGEVVDLHISELSLEKNGSLNLNIINDVCISGLDTYHQVSHKASLSYANPNQPVTLIK
jgi:flavin reductase (DIM6/NTAB) family NADH-FMN oxidoreductase RutF